MPKQSGFVSIPASAFSGVSRLETSFKGNDTGTALFFNVKVFAPVNLPDGATIISMRCGARAFFKRQISFTLRRNEPQQENIDIAVAQTSLDGTSFEFIDTNTITSGLVDNSKYNYYVVAEIEDPTVSPPTSPFCPDGECWVGYCRIGYTYD